MLGFVPEHVLEEVPDKVQHRQNALNSPKLGIVPLSEQSLIGINLYIGCTRIPIEDC